MTTNNAAPLNTFDDVTVINGLTARDWEEMARDFEAQARDRHQASADSFDRCDTDGFLSQWAADSTGRLLTAKASWARDHGYCRVNVLIDVKTRRVVSTLEKEGQYGDYWVLDDEATAAFGKRFFSESRAKNWARKRDANARKGFAIAAAMMPAHQPKLKGSSMISVSPCSQPDWDRRGELYIVDYDLLTTLSGLHDQDDAEADALRAGEPVVTDAEPVKEATARKGSHAECTHDNTKAARAKCRRTR